ncbi:MAG TPA: hypothetical protein VIT85_05605 [Solirubrobacterales bacterium]
MAAGLPGFGLGGLFFILSALLAPGRELWRTVRGRSSVAAWRLVGRQFCQAVAMLAAVYLMLRLVHRGPQSALPLTPMALTAALLIAVLLGAKLLALAERARISRAAMRRRKARPRPVPVSERSY